MVHTYHLLGIVHDLFGIVAYTLAICYYACKLTDLKRRSKNPQG